MDISKVDPNLIAGAVTLITTLFGYLWHKGRGEKTLDLSDLVDEAITHEVDDALDDGETLDTIEDRLTGAVGKLGLKLRVKLPENTVRLAVQWGVQAFRKRVKERKANQDAIKAIPSQLGEVVVRGNRIIDKLATVTPDAAVDTLTPAKEAGVELLAIGPDGKLEPAK
jgi:hypothetical protein